jgi:hypothetical protein
VSVRRGWLPCIGFALIAVAGLLVAGSRSSAVRVFALGAPNESHIAMLRPSEKVCEGPVTSPSPVRGVRIWGSSTGGRARLTVDVQDADNHQVLAFGSLEASPTAIDAPPTKSEHTAHLSRAVPGNRPLRICLTEDVNTFWLEGSSAIHPSVEMTGKTTGEEFSLVLLGDKRSLLSSLSTAFTRASLWRPSWVGSWTFWALAIGLLATFGLGIGAVASAAAEDDEEGPAGAD